MNTRDCIEDRKDLLALLPYEEHGILSELILDGNKSHAIVYSIYEGEELVCDALSKMILLIVLEGTAFIRIDSDNCMLEPLMSLTVPKSKTLTIVATSNCKVLQVIKI